MSKRSLLLSDISKEQPQACQEFTLSHKHIDISYQCIKHRGWSVSNSPHKMESSSILPSPQGERFLYPPLWEFKVSPRQGASLPSEKATCKLLISAGRTVLVNLTFDHDLPNPNYSKQSTPNTADLSSNTGQANHSIPNTVDPSSLNSRQTEQFDCGLPMQCDTLNPESIELNPQGIQLSNGHSETVESSV